MSYRPHGRARVNPDAPRAFARCDRCGLLYNHSDLRWQFDYRGPRLANLRILVCETCYDKPQPQLKPVLITQDPIPILNARPENYTYANTSQRSTSGQYLVPSSVAGNGTTAMFTFDLDSSITPPAAGTTIVIRGMVPETYNGTYLVTASTSTPTWTISVANSAKFALAAVGQVIINVDPSTGLPMSSVNYRITEDGDTRSTQPIGIPTGLNADAVPPLYQTTVYNSPLNVLSVTANGTYLITVTTSGAHGLSSNDVVAVEGTTNNVANGFYSILVTGGTTFTYYVNTPIVTGSLLGTSSRISKVLVGLPTGYDQVPQTGV